MATPDRRRAADELEDLARSRLDLVSYWSACERVVGRVVPGCFPLCWYTLDPATLLVTSHVNEVVTELPPEWLAEEYYGDDDLLRLADVVRSPRGVTTLHEATGGDPTSSRRWQENIALGADQEMIAGLRTRAGDVWAAVGLYRPAGQPLFDADDTAFLQAVSPVLADGARRALLQAEAGEPDRPESPAVLVLTDTWEVESTTPTASRWLADLPDGDVEAGRLPSAVLAVAGRALRRGTTPADAAGGAAVARVLCRSGTWAVLHGAPLSGDGPGRVAVIVEAAAPARISALLMAAYGLTAREQDVARLVLHGASTERIAATLALSPHTVQQHLKSVFEKTGVRSRRDLVGTVFFSHYEPRLRDNEQRVRTGRPVRGGPVAVRRTDVPARERAHRAGRSTP